MHVSATPYSGNPGRGAGKTRRGTGPWRMEAGGWKRRPETTAAPPPASHQLIVRSPYRCHQNKRTRVEKRLLWPCWLLTYPVPCPWPASRLRSAHPFLPVNRQTLLSTPSILPTPPPDAYLSWSLAAQSPPQDRRLFLFDSVLKETGLATRGPTAVTK